MPPVTARIETLNRLKGMHGIRLRPGSGLIELRGRLSNRTPLTQTFLWWANVAARVHDNYQSFFPTDVRSVADHAVRARSSFPLALNEYYGIDYAARPGNNDLTWYRNIPVPTSYMVCQTDDDFFGGYDHAAGGGFVHVADRHVSPGKKQWTWGNQEFGRAWETSRTADDTFATVHRNLGLASWNVRRDKTAARAHYERALACDPTDSRLVSEFVQLLARLGENADSRLSFLESRLPLVLDRDDATVELAALWNETGRPDQSLGRSTEAAERFRVAAEESGDFQRMAVTMFAELTVFKALALRELGRASEARQVLEALEAFARQEQTRPATIDYFATSLPNMLVFEEDIQESKVRRMANLLTLARQHLDPP